ncbi:MAG: lipid A biosynthesis acyltransferase [Nitrospirota bacterium]|nr:lipid A biosynthesis acyltransferase [Nitrospirota bacterium]MDH5585404.1 lipid A biosynthesis acyltransferase [Nitrospirota bacterium]MDH5773596.1 lipid A biosynthesis acyltransferase [Nitrospirota bacterium]
MAEHCLVPRRLIRRFPFLKKIAWKLEAWLLAGIVLILGALPLQLSGRLSGWLIKSLAGFTSRMRTTQKNLRLAFPDKTEQEIQQLSRETVRSLGLALSELLHMLTVWEQREQRLEFSIAQESEEVLLGDQPIVFVTAHTQAWQFTNFLAAQYNLCVSIIYAPESNPYFREFFLKLRKAFPARLVSRDGGIRTLARELKNGRSIGLAVDTRLDGAEMIPLFGIETPTNTTPARLALRYQCALIPVHVVRLPDYRYRICADKPILPDNPAASSTEQAINMTCQLNRKFEQWIREAPGQWICMKRRWPKEAYSQKSKSVQT